MDNKGKQISKRVKTTEQRYVEDRMGDLVDFSEIAELTVKGMDVHMKQSVLAMVPDVLRAMIFSAMGETIYECEHCEQENRVVTGDGDFRAQKYLLEQGLNWVPLIKTMNMNIGTEIELPQNVLASASQRKVDLDIMRTWVILGITEEDLIELHREVIREISDAHIGKLPDSLMGEFVEQETSNE